jgi:hypothetical protein
LLAVLVQPSFFPMPDSIYEAITQTTSSFVYSLRDETVEPTLAKMGNPLYRTAVEHGRFKKCTTYNCADWDFTGPNFYILGSRVFKADWLVLNDPGKRRVFASSTVLLTGSSTGTYRYRKSL